MGIFSFFPWMRRVYPACVSVIEHNSSLKKRVDDFMIDGNCIYHPCAQKVFKYGEFKPKKRFIHENKQEVEVPIDVLHKEVFSEICKKMDELIRLVNPKKRFIMCTDGSAPMAKQFQQRCRRYKSAMETSPESRDKFDSNCLTPGTEFMYKMSNHINKFLKHKKKTDPLYMKIEIIFNDERVKGEGEHKLINFIRKHPRRMKNNSFCIYSADADLIMLGLATQEEKFFILRENIYDKHLKQHFLINLEELRKDLLSVLIPINELQSCGSLYKYKTINDFVLLCFFVGNDFLPHMPSIEIKDGGIDQILRIYSKMNKKLTYYDGMSMVKIDVDNFTSLCREIAKKEPHMVNNRYNSVFYKKSTPLPCLDINVKASGNEIDFYNFKKDYYKDKLEITENCEIEKMCHDYIHGLQWVINYYTTGVPDWNWKCQHRYGPFIDDLVTHLATYTQKPYPKTDAIPPFLQLLCVLPPTSKNLLPPELRVMYEKRRELFQEDVKVDLEGKRYEYEGIVMVEDPNVRELKKEYNLCIGSVERTVIKRNRKGKVHTY